jgi:hypothetical protein
MTINGIGTMYYGRRNASSAAGQCEWCGQQTTLSEYETTLFFTIIYIPLIPPGKKQVLSECAACRQLGGCSDTPDANRPTLAVRRVDSARKPSRGRAGWPSPQSWSRPTWPSQPSTLAGRRRRRGNLRRTQRLPVRRRHLPMLAGPAPGRCDRQTARKQTGADKERRSRTGGQSADRS